MLKKIRLKNFKCFENLTLDMKKVNILTGLNGMGKSTIIQSLLLLKQSYIENVNLDNLVLNGKYIDLGTGYDVLYEKAGQDEQIGIGYETETEEVFHQYAFDSGSDKLPIIHKDSQATPSDDIWHGMVYLAAYRIKPQNEYHIINESELEAREFGNDGEYVLQYLKKHGEDAVSNRYVCIGDESEYFLLNQTRLWLDKIAPGVSPQVQVNMALRKSEVRYEFKEGREKTNSYKSINVGFGITYVLPIIIALLSAKEGDVVIIENPEAHIHPSGQRALGELMALVGEGGVQVVVETHSDHVLNGVRVAVRQKKVSAENIGIFFFYKNVECDYRHEVRIPHLDGNGRMDEWPEGFFDDWDKALLELL